MAGGVDVVLGVEGQRVGPFDVIATPGHAPDHVCLLLDGRIAFAGDTVLGRGSVFVGPGEGSLAAYLDSLRRLRELDLDGDLPRPRPVRGGPGGQARRVRASTAWTASAGWSRRWTRARATRRRCSTTPGPTCRPSCAAPPA